MLDSPTPGSFTQCVLESQEKPLESSFSATERDLYKEGHNKFSLDSEEAASPVIGGEDGCVGVSRKAREGSASI
jgi:hypothetical protein